MHLSEGRDLTASAHLFSLAVHPPAVKPAVPWSMLGLQHPDVEEGQGFFPQWYLAFWQAL